MDDRYRLSLACIVPLLLLLSPPPASAQPDTRVDSLVAEAERYRRIGAPAGALRHYRQILEVDPRHGGALRGLAEINLELENWQEAGRWADRVLDHEPEDTTAHYVRAIAYRERARLKLLLQHRDWSGAERHFGWILERDSLFRDVLVQYALLKQYAGNDSAAIRLADAQVRLRPDLADARMARLEVYDHFVRNESRKGVLSALASIDSDLARYFIGEKLRREGDLQAADSVYAALVDEPSRVPLQPLLLSRARVHFALGRGKRAQKYFDRAVQSIEAPEDAAYLFDDAKYVMNDDELAAYRSLRQPESFRRFFRTFWRRRDPLPAHTVNVRLAEHYRRLDLAETSYAYDGAVFWFNEPEGHRQLEFPQAYRLNERFNDKGLVLIRHGEPDRRATAVSQGSPPNESWRYLSTDLDFHFTIGEGGTGNNWRLTAVLKHPEVLRARESWGVEYRQILTARTLIEREHHLVSLEMESREHVLRGLSTDTHSWSGEVRALEFGQQVAAFRSADGKTRLHVYMGAPIDAARGSPVTEMSVEAGHTLLDRAWNVVDQHLDTLQVRLGSSGPVYAARPLVAPGSHGVAVHMMSTDADLVGGYRFEYTVPDFTAPGLAMSDVLLFHEVEDAEPPLSFPDADDISLGDDLEADVPFGVYFELYGLELGEDAMARYDIAYKLTPTKGRRKFLGILGPVVSRPALVVETTEYSMDESSLERFRMDLGDVPAGDYTLTITVLDNVSGSEVQKSRQVVLRK